MNSHPALARDPLPTVLPTPAVLGLVDPDDGDWARLRSLQYASLSDATFARTASQCAAAMATVALFATVISWLALLAWLGAVAVSLVQTRRMDGRFADAERRRLSREEIQAQWTTAVAAALVWCTPLAFFTPGAEPGVDLKFWTVLAMLMTALAVILPAAPMATVLFAAISGVGACAFFLLQGSLDMALIAVLFAAIIGFGAVEAGRRFLAARIAEASMAEKDAVVSLLLREFEEGEADWLWQTDSNRRIREISPRFAFALGRASREVEGQPFVRVIAGDAWETGDLHASLHDLAEQLKRREHFSHLLVRVTIGGSPRWWELSGKPRFDDDGKFEGFRGVGSDVTEARENSDKIAWLARYDTLTGLPNRMQLTEALAEALAAADKWRSRCAFLMLDLDRFKAINDTLGHLVGDKLLARVSQRLKDETGDAGLCGRLGGDEFAIVLGDAADRARIDDLADRVIRRLSQPYEIDSHLLYVGVSVGSAIGPRDGDTVETLMRNADLALYRSKDAGGNTHRTYEPALHAQAEERRQLEVALRVALDRNELHVAYQPVVDAQSERVVSFEALLRWDSLEHGMVSPAKFIPLAEDTRLVVPIGEWVLHEACREATHWPNDIRIAVNVSGEQLLDASFVPAVVSALAASGLPAHRLELEVTESIFVRDANLARSALEQVIALGCAVALDDFGTGYSSLGYIRKLRFSTIKVDRSFVQGAATGNVESLAIIRAVVAMADSLEMSTTAEGVETASELEMIRKLGCRKIQGYLFGRPMRGVDARRLFRGYAAPAARAAGAA